MDLRTDVYSLGVVLCELVCGARPHDVTGLTFGAAARKIAEEEPRLEPRCPGIHRRDLVRILRKTLEKDPGRRYQSPGELGASLCRVGEREEGLALLREAVVGRSEALGPAHPDTLVSRNTIAVNLMRERRFAEAVPVLREVLDGHAEPARRAASRRSSPAPTWPQRWPRPARRRPRRTRARRRSRRAPRCSAPRIPAP